MRQAARAAVLAAMLGLWAGCGGAEGAADDADTSGVDASGPELPEAEIGAEATPEPDAVPYDGPPVVHGAAVLGASVEGRPVVAERFGDAGPVVLVFAAIHGNEVPAQQVVERLRSGLLARPERLAGLRLVLATLINPDGFVATTRTNAHGVDLNRNFAASNFEPSPTYGPSALSEPESAVVARMVEEVDPAVIVSIHSPLDAINYDGPARELAEAMAAAASLPIDQDIGIYPGSFGSWAGVDLQIPTITLELPPGVAALSDLDPWLTALHAALAWAAERGGPGVPLTGLIPDGGEADGYRAWRLGDSAGGRPLLVEELGGAGAPVLVVAGLDGAAAGVLAAERLRALLLARAQPEAPSVVLVTVANPDGVAAGRPLDQAGCDPDRAYPTDGNLPAAGADATAPCVEGRALAALVATLAPRALVVLGGSDRAHAATTGPGAEGLAAAYADATWAAPEDLGAPTAGSLAGWAAARGVPSLVVTTPANPPRALMLRAGRAAEGVEAATCAP